MVHDVVVVTHFCPPGDAIAVKVVSVVVELFHRTAMDALPGTNSISLRTGAACGVTVVVIAELVPALFDAVTEMVCNTPPANPVIVQEVVAVVHCLLPGCAVAV